MTGLRIETKHWGMNPARAYDLSTAKFNTDIERGNSSYTISM